ncbi:sulfoxide reductase heme-binding subunit YedZ [bacterium]|nr:sulfoxide reductase heme-binding subunit YedZ [bacterium]MCB2179169.1 sulfoxide reductase heme-binding subunit YedZ [bacterium]
MKRSKPKITPLQVLVHLGAWIPLILIVVAYANNQLTVNPIQDIEQRTGRLAILWVVLSLSVTPLATIFGWKELNKRSRTIGLYAFMIAALHVSIFVALDYGMNFGLIWDAIVEKRFILYGLIAFTGLTAMAATSFKYWQKKLRKNWKRLHRTIYVIAPLIVIHYALAKKGDIFSLQGDIVRPLIYAGIVTLLLVLRIKPVKLFIKKQWGKLTGKVSALVQRKKIADNQSAT